MGCCQSSFPIETHPENDQQAKAKAKETHQSAMTHHPPPSVGLGPTSGGVPTFSEFSFAQLKAATNYFSSDCIVSESGEKAPNLVYKGRLQNRRWIAVKKFTKMAWPDPEQFVVC